MAPYLNTDSYFNDLDSEISESFVLIDGVTSDRSYDGLDTELEWDAKNKVLKVAEKVADDERYEDLILVDENIWKKTAEDIDVLGLWKWDDEKEHYVRQMEGKDISFIFFGHSTTRTDELFVCTDLDTIVGRDLIHFEHECGDMETSLNHFIEMKQKLLELKQKLTREQ